MTGLDQARRGLIAGVITYLIWGLFPVYLKALAFVPPQDVLAYRVLSAAIICLIVTVFTGQITGLGEVLSDKKRLALLCLSSLVIGGNWLVYILAITHDRVLDASLGYFINPLISVVLGVIIFRERLRPSGWVAVALAAAGVVLLTLEKGALPVVALSLAMSFSLYSVVRKYVQVDALTGLLVETLVLVVPASLWLILAGTFGPIDNVAKIGLLAISGPMTAIPLVMFAFAARRLPLATLGLVQYITPTMVFLLGVFVYNEPLSRVDLLAFAAIWTGLAIYAADGLRHMRRRPLAQPVDLR